MTTENLAGESLEQKAREFWEEWAVNWRESSHFSFTPQIKMDVATRFAAAFARHLSAWVPVTERLPEICNEVVICTTGGFALTGYLSRFGWRTRNHAGIAQDSVTHWQPLPSAGGEEGKS